jgi:hypothetical protein
MAHTIPQHRIEFGAAGSIVLGWAAYASPEEARAAFEVRSRLLGVGGIVALYVAGELEADAERLV